MDENKTISDPRTLLAGKEILLAVGGGISAYKSADLVSKLVQSGAGVTVIMTNAGTKFVTPLTFQALSGRPVRVDLFDLPDSSDPQHISLTEKANLFLIAPSTADLIAKAAHGICDDLVSTMICASGCPVAHCPAMNWRMWENPITQENVKKLQSVGHRFIGPESGWLACRHVGSGRMSDPSTILQTVIDWLKNAH
jgi:phosphopantothenoylcysteine decarboxylase/phosphopantothenate--cysteine ligase